MRNPGRTVTRRMLEDRLWDRETEHVSNVLDVYARRLRMKVAPAVTFTAFGCHSVKALTGPPDHDRQERQWQ